MTWLLMDGRLKRTPKKIRKRRAQMELLSFGSRDDPAAWFAIPDSPFFSHRSRACCRSRRRHRRRRRCPLTTSLVIKKSLSTVASDSYNFPVTRSDHNSSEFLASGTMRNERQWYYFVLISLFVRRGPLSFPSPSGTSTMTAACPAPLAVDGRSWSSHCWSACFHLPFLSPNLVPSTQSTGTHSPSPRHRNVGSNISERFNVVCGILW